MRRYRAANPERAAAAHRRRFAAREDSPVMRRIMEAKAQPCSDCGVRYHSAAMQLDHVRGKKLFNVGRAAWSRSLAAVEVEIAKCDVRCANCHAIRHYELGVNHS